MSAICLHAFISGKVQGVYYRFSTQHQAWRLGVTGWAKNLSDGRVEVLLCGEEAAVYELASWLQQGPPEAEVESVKSEVIHWQLFVDFTTS
jgi:acylphosphatase